MESCKHCEPETCSVLLFSRESDWGREGCFRIKNCEVTLVNSRSAMTAYLAAIKDIAEHPDKLSDEEETKKSFMEKIQNDIIILDCSLEEANKLLEFFVQSDGSFPKEVILVHRNYDENGRSLSFTKLKGTRLALEPVSYHGDLTTALSEQSGYSVAS